MKHQLKRIERSGNRRAEHKLVGVSVGEREEWLWTAFVKKGNVGWVFVSSRPKMINSREVDWKSQDTVPEDVNRFISELAQRVDALFKASEVS
ncbi:MULTISPECIES: hypothetical protein [Pontibacillus]|uniref:Uncharacterized protein n=1 Tax=Pontibacillus chungwhensis TaxID=265426 RepID=A0ABY8UY17_9BACI|nr:MULTISPECIES: hypothetical protein [Pontibacillus]MCD5325435.1 hypothetical protein [Pontibacillus sp. HN14]WIF98550.1 hypothetical protein QNI29_02450 [Pontibacillus chungwhensis]